MSKSVLWVVTGIFICGLGACLYYLNLTSRLEHELKRIEVEDRGGLAKRIERERDIVAKGLQHKHAPEMAAFARLAQELEREKEKAKAFKKKP